VLVRHGKGGRRREVGMDAWGWEELQPWLERRLQLPVGPLFCVINGPTNGLSTARPAREAVASVAEAALAEGQDLGRPHSEDIRDTFATGVAEPIGGWLELP
jgi:hypothetical protein